MLSKKLIERARNKLRSDIKRHVKEKDGVCFYSGVPLKRFTKQELIQIITVFTSKTY